MVVKEHDGRHIDERVGGHSCRNHIRCERMIARVI